MNKATSLRHDTNGFSKNLSFWRPSAMNSEKPSGSCLRKASQRSMSTPPSRKAVLMQWWMSPSSMSDSNEACGARDQVGIAGGVDHHLGEDGVPAFLALEDGALDGVALQDRRGGPGVQQQAHLGLAHHAHGQRLERFRIDGRRPGDDAVVGGGPLRPVGRRRRVLASPSRRAAGPGWRPWAGDPSARRRCRG